MKQFNRKPLFFALALTLAAPLAFAQSTYPQSSTPQSTDPQTTTQPTQSQDTSTQPTTTTQDPAATTQSTQPANPMATTPTTSEPMKKNWSDLDLDKNGSLSATEAAPVSSLSKSFTTADANADGQLTQDEYKAFLASSGKEKAPGSGN